MTQKTKATRTLAGILLALFGTSWGGQAISGDLSDAISAEKQVSLFARAADRTGLRAVLKGPGRFMLFIPSDKAMANEGSAFLLKSVLLTEQNSERLADLVRHHVVRAGGGTDLAGDVELQTLANVPLDVARVGNGHLVAGQAVIIDRIEADNGAIYVVDRLLWPRDPRWESARQGQLEPAALANGR